MTQTTLDQPSRYLMPPASCERANELAAALNAQLRLLHEQGKCVYVLEDHLTKTGEHPLPQIRIDVREPENAIGRSEELDA